MLFKPDVTAAGLTGMTTADAITRLLIADASSALRLGLRMIFGLDETLTVSAEAATSDELEQMALQTQPHVIVFDADMPGVDRAIRFILRGLPKCQLVGLTMQTSAQFHGYVMEMGAFACIEKRASPMELLEAVQSARNALGSF
jgi:DNA-binding NarL/FixJ family response regulator